MTKNQKPQKANKSAKRKPVGQRTTKPQGNLGKYIQSVLDKKGFSQGEVANRGGIDSGNITNMIGGSKRNPEFNTIRKLAVGLGEPYLRVCAALLGKEEKEREGIREYWFDERLMLIDDLLSQIPEIERGKVEALIEALEYSLTKAYKETIAKAKRKQLEV